MEDNKTSNDSLLPVFANLLKPFQAEENIKDAKRNELIREKVRATIGSKMSSDWEDYKDEHQINRMP